MLSRLTASLRRQPVRAYLYGLLAPAIGVAGAYGLVTEAKGALWIALGSAVLLPAGVEVARSKVTPVADPHDDEGRPLRARCQTCQRSTRPPLAPGYPPI